MNLFLIFFVLEIFSVIAKENDGIREDHNEKSLSFRISNGKFAKRGQFPYQVGLKMKFPKGLVWCGGSLLSENYVLTASHCLEGPLKGYVYLGAHNISDKHDNSTIMKVTSENFIQHPEYNDTNLMNDIALIKLPKPYILPDKNQYVKLPSPNLKTTSGKAIASGWGRYSNDKNTTISKTLRYVELNLMTLWPCKHYHGSVISEKNVCTHSKNKEGVCTGDSGGPLVIRQENDQIIQIGVISFVSNRGCFNGYPSVFIRVGSYVDWIKQITGISYEE